MLVGGRPQVLWEGLAELRADAPSKARGAEGERGRPPPSSNTQCPITPGTRQIRPTKKVTFPRDKAEKSPFQQHDLSILTVGPNQLKYRLSRTRKPKSRVIGHHVWVGGQFQERRGRMCSVQGWPHWLQGWRHRPDRWLLGPLHAQVNPTGGSPGGPPTLPPIGPSCVGTG